MLRVVVEAPEGGHKHHRLGGGGGTNPPPTIRLTHPSLLFHNPPRPHPHNSPALRRTTMFDTKVLLFFWIFYFRAYSFEESSENTKIAWPEQQANENAMCEENGCKCVEKASR